MSSLPGPCTDCDHHHLDGRCRIAEVFYLDANPARVRTCGCPTHRIGPMIVRRNETGRINYISERILMKIRVPT